MSEFKDHLTEVSASLERRRADLLMFVRELNDVDLVRSRRGGWSVGRVLEHIIGSEWHYARLASQLRGMEGVSSQDEAVTEVAGAIVSLGRSRVALLKAIEGVTEEDFYQLSNVGREEYSVVSVLENVEQHDLEHLSQLKSIRAAPL